LPRLEITSGYALADNQAFSEHCETTDTGWCIRRYACLLSQLTPGTHSAETVTHLGNNRA